MCLSAKSLAHRFRPTVGVPPAEVDCERHDVEREPGRPVHVRSQRRKANSARIRRTESKIRTKPLFFFRGTNFAQTQCCTHHGPRLGPACVWWRLAVKIPSYDEDPDAPGAAAFLKAEPF